MLSNWWFESNVWNDDDDDDDGDDDDDDDDDFFQHTSSLGHPIILQWIEEMLYRIHRKQLRYTLSLSLSLC